MDESSTEPIRVLHVEDEVAFAELTAEYLDREFEECEITVEPNPSEGVARLESSAAEFDCIVSDYNMPGRTGIEFLEEVREHWPDIPFILFTGRGSEEIASEAISAGVTDYLQKGGGSEQYTVLANRIQNAVSQYRAEQAVEETEKWYRTILEHSSDYVMIVNGNGIVTYVSPAIERVMGYEPDEVIGTHSFDFAHPDDIERAASTLAVILDDTTKEPTIEFRAQHADGSWRWLETRGRNLLEDPVINGVMVNVRDITERKKRDQDLKRETERLQDLTSFISHDVRNQLSLIDGHISLAESDLGNSEHLETARAAVERIDTMIDKIRELAQSGKLPSDPEPTAFKSIAEACWDDTLGTDVNLSIEDDFTLEADEQQLRSLLENLFLNAIEHGNATNIRSGQLDDEDGFYVADDGEGILVDDVDQVFDAGYTTAEEGSGLGLAIVKDVAETHDWSIELEQSEAGGVRFEFHDVTIS